LRKDLLNREKIYLLSIFYLVDCSWCVQSVIAPAADKINLCSLSHTTNQFAYKIISSSLKQIKFQAILLACKTWVIQQHLTWFEYG